MRGFWFRIALGALLVFIVGMSAIQVVRSHVRPTTETVRASFVSGQPAREAVAAVASAALVQVANHTRTRSRHDGPIAFMLGGEDLGQITRLFAERKHAGERANFTLTVELHSATSIPQILSCDLIPNNPADDDFSFDDGFRCIEGERRGLETVGTIRFFPGDVTRPVRMRSSAIRNLERGDPFKLNVDLTQPVRVRVEGDKGEKLSLQADEGGAVMHAKDDQGRERVRLVADSTGAFLQVVDDQGRVVFRLAANESGVSMTAKDGK